MSIDIAGLSEVKDNAPGRGAAVSGITMADLEPYSELLEQWGRTDGADVLNQLGTSIDRIKQLPTQAPVTLSAFARWMVDNNIPDPARPTPVKPTLESLGTPITVEQFNLIADANGNINTSRSAVAGLPWSAFEPLFDLMAGRGISRTALGLYRSSGFRPAAYSMAISIAFHRIREENLIDLTPKEESMVTGNYVPWGPTHPDWDAFWDKAERAADSANYCSEFDAIVKEVGGRPRATHEKVTIDITKLIDVVMLKGRDPSPTDVVRAMENQLSWGDWSETSRIPTADPHGDLLAPF